MFLFTLAYTAKKSCDCFPRVYYKVIAWLGLYTIMDPIIVLTVDLVSQSF